MKKLLAPFVLLPVAALAAHQPSSKLLHFQYITKQGLVVKLADKAKLNLSGQNIEYLSDAKQTVTKVAANGDVTVVEVDSNVSIMVNGSPMPGPTNPSTTATMSKDGLLKDFSSESSAPGSTNDISSQTRLFNLTMFAWPKNLSVKPGEKWEVKVPASKKLETYPIIATYTAEGYDSVGSFKAIKVKFSIKEDGIGTNASSSGEMWIDAKDGMTDKVIANVKDVTMAGAPGTVDGTLTVIRQS